MSLTRDDQHRYFWHDRRVPGVTEVLQGVGLIDTQWFTEEGRERGRYVHEACQYLLEGDLAWDALEDKYRPWVESFALWVDAVKPEVLELETLHYSETYGYAGQLDWLLCVDFDTWLIDGKSGAVSPWVGLQTAAYQHLLDDHVHIRRAALKLRKDGQQASLKPMKDEQDWDDFRHALGCFNAKMRLAGGWNGSN